MKRNITRQGVARIWTVLSLFIIAGSWAGWAWLAVVDHQEIESLKAQLRTEHETPKGEVSTHELRVINRISERVFTAWTLNPATQEWYEATYSVCDGPLGLSNEIEAGATLKLFQYHPDYSRKCMDISTKFDGYILERDQYGKAILAAFTPRSTTPPGTSPEAP